MSTSHNVTVPLPQSWSSRKALTVVELLDAIVDILWELHHEDFARLCDEENIIAQHAEEQAGHEPGSDISAEEDKIPL